MQRKFPARTCSSVRSPANRQHGFSLIEVLVALLVLGLLAVAIGQAAFLSLLAEHRADRAQESVRILQALVARNWLGDKSPDESTDSWTGWSLDVDSVEVEVDEQSVPASVYRLRHVESGFTTELLLWP